MKVVYLLALFFSFSLLISAQLPVQIETAQQIQNDNNVLNYALSLEQLEYNFYSNGLANFNAQSFTNFGLPSSTFGYLNLIQSHAQAHIALLTATLQSRNVTPVQPCVYNFSTAFQTVPNFIATARVLKENGVSAYDGSANAINDAELLETAATIATIEGRDAAFLNLMLSQLILRNTTVLTSNNSIINVTSPYPPFPNNFDVALLPGVVVSNISRFIVSCPNTTTLPVIAYTLVPVNFTSLTALNVTFVNASGQTVTTDQFNNDNRVLNYAYTLELLGRAFYSQASNFTAADFVRANFSVNVYNNFRLLIANELAHVAFFNQTLTSRGATAAVPCTYNLGNFTTSVTAVLQFARTLENLEVTAYDGAINRLTEYDLIQAAASIATVEARHGQWLDDVLLGIGVLNVSTDIANDPATILNITAPLFGPNCVTPTIPVEAYLLQPQFLAAQLNSASGIPGLSPSLSPSISASTTPSLFSSLIPSNSPGTPISTTPSFSSVPSASPIGFTFSPSPSSTGSSSSQLSGLFLELLHSYFY